MFRVEGIVKLIEGLPGDRFLGYLYVFLDFEVTREKKV